MQIKAEKFNLDFGQTQIPIYPRACKQGLLCLRNAPCATSSSKSATPDQLLLQRATRFPSHPSDASVNEWYLRAVEIKAHGANWQYHKAVYWLLEHAALMAL